MFAEEVKHLLEYIQSHCLLYFPSDKYSCCSEWSWFPELERWHEVSKLAGLRLSAFLWEDLNFSVLYLQTILKVDEGEWKWMKVDKMDENGWRWRKVLLNWDYGFLCFSSAVWLSIIICYESASLGSILFLREEKSNRYKLFLHE